MVLAIASYHFIEKPFRYPRIIREKRVLVVSSFAIFMGLSYPVYSLIDEGMSDSRYSSEVTLLADSTNFNNPDLAMCRVSANKSAPTFRLADCTH